MTSYTEKDAARDTGSSKREVERAWHQARDDSGRGDYNDRLRDPYYKDQASRALSDMFRDSGIPDIQSLPEGYE